MEEISASSGNESSRSSDDDDQAFFDAAPAPKRTASSKSAGRDDDSASDKWQPNKRVRTTAPSTGEKGVKRAATGRSARAARLDHPDRAGGLDELSDTDNSFVKAARAQRPVKKARTGAPTAVNGNKGKRRAVEPRHTAVEELSEPGPSTLKIRVTKKRTKRHPKDRPRTSTSFNFTPTNIVSTFEDERLAASEADRSEGNAHYRSGRYSDSLVSYTRALEAYPNTITIPPPLSILTNRAAAYISLGDYQNALSDMQRALSYPSSDAEGTVKRLSRLFRCYLALSTFDGEEVAQAIQHMQNQLVLLERIEGTVKTRREAQKALDALQKGVETAQYISTAREKYEWSRVLDGLETLETLGGSPPEAWKMMRAEALGMLARVDEARGLVANYIKRTDDGDPAALWFQAIFAFAGADLARAVSHLDAMRLVTVLPTQASRLLHRAYSLSALSQQAQVSFNGSRWSKASATLSEILRLAPDEQPINWQLRWTTLLSRAEVFARAGKLDEALADCFTVAEHPSVTDSFAFKAYIVQSRVHVQQEDAKQAAQALEAALQRTQGVSSLDLKMARFELKKLKAPETDGRRWRDGASPYEVLNIPPSATSAEIRKAYKRESLLNHPDKTGGDAEHFKRISEAYSTLTTTRQARTSTAGSSWRR